jgi:microcystin degradation protein MlrC
LKGDFIHNAGDVRRRFDFFSLFLRLNRGESPGGVVQPARDVARRTRPAVGISGWICRPWSPVFLQAIAAGIGARVTLSIGGKIAMPAIPAESPSLTVTGTVKTISNGRYRNRGPMARGVMMDMGNAVVLDTGPVEIVLISRHVEPSDLNCLSSLGIDPLQKRYVMLKSRIHWRAGLGPMAKAVVECAGVGVCTSDYGQLTFERVRRPIYPLDLPNR